MEWTAIATFILASIAAASIVTTLIIRAKDIKKERQTRDEDRKLRLLDEARDWAREAVKLGFLYERAQSKSEVRQVLEDMIEDVAKTTDAADMAAEIFKDKLDTPVTEALGFVKSYKDPSKFATDEYFDSLFRLLKAINAVKRKLLSL